MAQGPIGFYRLEQILKLIPVSSSTWWSWVADGKAPQPIKLGPRMTAWKQACIHDFINTLCETIE